MRTFPSERVQRADAGPPAHVVTLQCLGHVPGPHPGPCGKRLEITSKSREALPADFVHRQASIKGWHVGKHPAADRCPDCLHRRKLRPTVAAQIKEPEPVQHKIPIMPAAVRATSPLSGASSAVATAVREMTKDERRIIFAKIDEVYSDGYTAGWTDKRVAEDLNVPRAWVENIRAEFFGEAKDNEVIRQFMADLDAAKEDLEGFATARQSMLKRMDDLAVKVSRLLKIGEEIRKAMTP